VGSDRAPSVPHQTRTRSELATQPYVGVTVRFRRAAVERLDEMTGVGRTPAQTIIAEIGTDMARFPTAGHLAS
jgi:transposase